MKKKKFIVYIAITFFFILFIEIAPIRHRMYSLHQTQYHSENRKESLRMMDYPYNHEKRKVDFLIRKIDKTKEKRFVRHFNNIEYFVNELSKALSNK